MDTVHFQRLQNVVVVLMGGVRPLTSHRSKIQHVIKEFVQPKNRGLQYQRPQLQDMLKLNVQIVEPVIVVLDNVYVLMDLTDVHAKD